MSQQSSDPKPWYGRRGELLVVIQFLILFGFIFMPIWRPITDPALLADLAPLRWAVLVASWLVAFAFGAFGALHLREFITPLPYPVNHSQLVQHGVYGWVRHPLYSSQLFAALGWVVFTASLSHLAVLIVGFLFFDYKASREEEWLQARHPEYADYARRVRKFIPWIY
jgi:protein-S-isoprenylcysteine O-methyltransferase Ste14